MSSHRDAILTSDSVERPPNHSLSFLVPREHPDQTRTGFGSESLLLRGCTIRNTELAVGIVIYAGHCPQTPSFVPFLYPPSSIPSSTSISSQRELISVLRGRVMELPISQLSRLRLEPTGDRIKFQVTTTHLNKTGGRFLLAHL